MLICVFASHSAAVCLHRNNFVTKRGSHWSEKTAEFGSGFFDRDKSYGSVSVMDCFQRVLGLKKTSSNRLGHLKDCAKTVLSLSCQ